jgi:hypothetical protein
MTIPPRIYLQSLPAEETAHADVVEMGFGKEQLESARMSISSLPMTTNPDAHGIER